MTLDDVVAIESIRKLKAKYLRFMGQRRWDEWIALFVPDATTRVTVSDEEYCFWHGVDESQASNAERNIGNRSVHHGHVPDIEIVSATAAKGSWMLFDTYLFETGRIDQYGYHADEYQKVGDEWNIKSVECHLYPA